MIDTFLQESPILDRLKFVPVEGSAYAYNQEETLPNVSFISPGGSFPESTGTISQAVEVLKEFGGDSDVPALYQDTMSNLQDQRATALKLTTKSMYFEFQDKFINGDTDSSDSKEFDGLKKRLVGSQVITPDAPIPVVGNGGSDVHAFLDKLDELLSEVVGINGNNGAIYVNKYILGKMRSAFRHVSADLQLQTDIYGKRVVMWNGIPIHDIGEDLSGSDILPQTEILPEDEDENPTSSIYAVRFSDVEKDAGVIGLSDSELIKIRDIGLLEGKDSYRARVKMYAGLAIFNGKSASRLMGVLNG
ncbi:MAG: hypothetical protein LBI63_01800 [Candidatus Ancillula sp.]|nr:hypothetical protein [Candidatus Ancillula sp.]